MIEAVDPTTTHLTSLLYIYKVFDNLYMLWMCIWMYHDHFMAAHVDEAMWNFATNLGKSQMICDCKKRWLRLSTQLPLISHHCYIYIRCLTTYMLWMCIWMCPHHITAAHVDQALWNFATNLGKSQMICDGKKQWLRLSTQPPLISHHCYIYIRCLTTFICCGCAHGCIFI